MSLEATHIKFAVGQKDRYKVSDLKAYILGSIYPDSRYLTRIDRNLTHNEKILSDDFVSDDFRKGWQSHCIFDAEYNRIRKELFYDLFKDKNETDDWMISTAIKIAADWIDIQDFDLQNYLDFLDEAENPNHEDISKVREYNQLIKNTYQGKSVYTMDDYRFLLKGLGVDEAIGNQAINKAEELLSDDKYLTKIKNIYYLILDLTSKKV